MMTKTNTSVRSTAVREMAIRMASPLLVDCAEYDLLLHRHRLPTTHLYLPSRFLRHRPRPRRVGPTRARLLLRLCLLVLPVASPPYHPIQRSMHRSSSLL